MSVIFVCIFFRIKQLGQASLCMNFIYTFIDNIIVQNVLKINT